MASDILGDLLLELFAAREIFGPVEFEVDLVGISAGVFQILAHYHVSYTFTSPEPTRPDLEGVTMPAGPGPAGEYTLAVDICIGELVGAKIFGDIEI